MPWQSPPIGGQQRARPPREGLPPFPTGRGEQPGGVFQRTPPGFGDRPIPTPPDIPSPGVVLRTGARNNRSALFDPVNVFAYGSVAALVAVLARKARGDEPRLDPEPPVLQLDTRLRQRPPFEPFGGPAPQRKTAGDSLAPIGDVLRDLGEFAEHGAEGKAEGLLRDIVFRPLVRLGLVTGTVVSEIGVSTLGSSDEDEVNRRNDALKEQRRIMAERIFLALGFVPGRGTGGPGGFVGPQDVADP